MQPEDPSVQPIRWGACFTGGRRAARSPMPRRIRDTPEVRALLREWAADTADRSRAERAHNAYVSTSVTLDDGFFIVVDEQLLEELSRHVVVEPLPPRD
jgi:hypothetical protein